MPVTVRPEAAAVGAWPQARPGFAKIGAQVSGLGKPREPRILFLYYYSITYQSLNFLLPEAVPARPARLPARFAALH
jgi:hypothetical protein